MKKTILLLAGIAACVSLTARADSQVTVHYFHQSETAVVSHAQNLAQLVTSPALVNKTWWPGTVIAEREATAVVLQQQKQLLARLTAWGQALRADDDADKAAVIDNVVQQLSAIHVTGRQFTALDPDWVRMRPTANRTLEGDYSVYTLQKPTTVTVSGLVGNTGKTPWVPGYAVSDYLSERERLSGAERNVALLISPAGDVQEVPVAYWNRRHIEPEPGSIIYVGFSSWSLPGEYDDLNQQIVSVLTHRIPD